MSTTTTAALRITPIFAAPFAIVPCGVAAPLNAHLAALLKGRATQPHRDPDVRPDALCFRGREDLFEWQEEPVLQLRQLILAGVCSAVMAVNRYTEREFDALGMQARARFVLVRPNGSLPASSAPMASWLGLYCIAAPRPNPTRTDSAALRLYAIRDPTLFMDAANYRLRQPFAGAHHLWQPVPGEMAVFPASILHEVALNDSDTDLLLVVARVRFAHSGQETVPPW